MRLLKIFHTVNSYHILLLHFSQLYKFYFFIRPHFNCSLAILNALPQISQIRIDAEFILNLFMKLYNNLPYNYWYRFNYSLIFCASLISVKSKFPYAYSTEFPYRTNHILECEFYLLENLDCCLIVYQPYRPLMQILQDACQEVYELFKLHFCFYYSGRS